MTRLPERKAYSGFVRFLVPCTLIDTLLCVEAAGMFWGIIFGVISGLFFSLILVPIYNLGLYPKYVNKSERSLMYIDNGEISRHEKAKPTST